MRVFLLQERAKYAPSGVSLRRLLLCGFLALCLFAQGGERSSPAGVARFDGFGALVAETHASSLKLRETSLRRAIAKDTCWPAGVWGDNLWCLAALALNERVEEANARILREARAYIEARRTLGVIPAPTPEEPGNAPWTFFSLGEYVRTLCLFHARSPHFPGRLTPESEAAMKEALWLWVREESRVDRTGPEDLLLLLGTENHDLCKRPNHYLVLALLLEDPAYRERTLADGRNVAEHVTAYTAFYREWPRRRAGAGLWVEIGSNGYQKYSWPALFNLHELAPDPLVRRRFGLLLDLAFIEEEQISVNGRRGGGRSRAYPASNSFESYKNLLYAVKGLPAGSSHSRIIETSRYQLPAEAILLRRRLFPAAAPFVICNRVLGELEAFNSGDAHEQRLAADSALVNYAYRTPYYLLGSTLQDPSLAMTNPATGKAELVYAGISRQNRVSEMLFDDPQTPEVASVHTVIQKTRGGRPQQSFWSVQHENILVLQRIVPGKGVGSYSTGWVGIGFSGGTLKIVETNGWIFAGNGKAFAGVKFLDGPYHWEPDGRIARPAAFADSGDRSRILLLAGDVGSHATFDAFQSTAAECALTVTPEMLTCKFGGNRLDVASFDARSAGGFTLPRVNGRPVDLRPVSCYSSPFLKGDSGSDRIAVEVGPVSRVLDFGGGL